MNGISIVLIQLWRIVFARSKAKKQSSVLFSLDCFVPTNDMSTLVMLNRHSALDAEQHLHIIRRLRVKPAMTFGCHLRLFD